MNVRGVCVPVSLNMQTIMNIINEIGRVKLWPIDSRAKVKAN